MMDKLKLLGGGDIFSEDLKNYKITEFADGLIDVSFDYVDQMYISYLIPPKLINWSFQSHGIADDEFSFRMVGEFQEVNNEDICYALGDTIQCSGQRKSSYDYKIVYRSR